MFSPCLALALLVVLTIHGVSSLSSEPTSPLAGWRESLPCQLISIDGGSGGVLSRLEGSGAHRQLIYSVNLSSLTTSSVCGLSVVYLGQDLPLELFVDPYQLEEVTRQTGWASFETWGALDLESPSTACSPTAVTVRLDKTAWEQSNQGVADALLLVAVPIHSRYPAPTNQTGQNSNEWWAPLSTGLVDVVIPSPNVIVKCAMPKTGQCYELELVPQDGNEQILGAAKQLIWRVPTGSLQHAELVSLGTAIAASVACVVLLAVLFRDRLTSDGALGKLLKEA